MSREEDAYVIERMGKLLAEIAIIVNGPEPHDTLWSYHDLPEKVRALKQAQQPAALAVPEGWVAVPRRLTAENGGKFEFLGATFDGYRVPWGAVKAVHKAIVAWADQLAAAERAKGVES